MHNSSRFAVYELSETYEFFQATPAYGADGSGSPQLKSQQLQPNKAIDLALDRLLHFAVASVDRHVSSAFCLVFCYC
ncbi:MAG: hypothetical protein ACI915_004753 [Gammaproteobacteria bacterium]|jgi:hypothetical protein